MAEEATDVTQPVETATVETTAETVETTTDQSSQVEQTTDQSEETQSEEPSEASAEVEQAEETVTDESEQLKPKSENRFQKLANDNRALRERIKQLEQLKVPTEEDYIDQGLDENAAKIESFRAELQYRDAVEAVVGLNQSINTDLERLKREYPAFDPDSKEFNEKLTMSVFAQYDKDTGAEYDPETGIMIRTTQLPYQYIKEKMDLVSMAAAKSKVEAQKNVEKMVAAADVPTSTQPIADTQNESLEEMRERLAGIKF